MQKIGEVRGLCFSCGWWGTVYEAKPDVDGEGSLGCPQCLSVVKFGAFNKVRNKLSYNVRIFMVLSVGANIGGLLWLLFGNR